MWPVYAMYRRIFSSHDMKKLKKMGVFQENGSMKGKIYRAHMKMFENRSQKIVMHNHLENNWNLSNKKALFMNMKVFGILFRTIMKPRRWTHLNTSLWPSISNKSEINNMTTLLKNTTRDLSKFYKMKRLQKNLNTNQLSKPKRETHGWSNLVKTVTEATGSK